MEPLTKPLWRNRYKKIQRTAANWLESIDLLNADLNSELTILSTVTELSGEALAQFCEDQGYSKVARLVRQIPKVE